MLIALIISTAILAWLIIWALNPMDQLPQTVKEFVREKTQWRDSSHDFEHHKKVAENVQTICNAWLKECDGEQSLIAGYTNERAVELLTTAAWVHDVIDHKYVNTSKKINKLNNKLISCLSDNRFTADEIYDIMFMIHNMSFSQEKRIEKIIIDKINDAALNVKRPETWTFTTKWKDVAEIYKKELLENVSGFPIMDGHESLETALTILMDADRIEAIGKVGIERCIAYTRAKNPDADDEKINKKVKKHINEKLRYLWTTYIRTDIAKEMGKDAHKYVPDWYDNH